MCIIVIFGLPGSGKTTCINELLNDKNSLAVELLSRNDFERWARKQSKLKKIVLVLRSATTYFFILTPYLKIAFRNFSSGIEFWKRVLVSPIYFIYMKNFMKSSNQFYLSDHGAVQELWSLLIRSRSIPDQYIHRVIDMWRKQFSFRYIYFQTNPSIAAKRIVNRKYGQSPFDGKSFAQIENELIIAHDCYERISSILEDSGITINYLHNESELSTAVTGLRQFVLRKA